MNEYRLQILKWLMFSLIALVFRFETVWAVDLGDDPNMAMASPDDMAAVDPNTCGPCAKFYHPGFLPDTAALTPLGGAQPQKDGTTSGDK